MVHAEGNVQWTIKQGLYCDKAQANSETIDRSQHRGGRTRTRMARVSDTAVGEVEGMVNDNPRCTDIASNGTTAGGAGVGATRRGHRDNGGDAPAYGDRRRHR